MRGGYRSQPGALLRALFELRPGRLLEMDCGAGAAGVRIEADMDGLTRGWARTGAVVARRASAVESPSAGAGSAMVRTGSEVFFVYGHRQRVEI